MKNPYAKFTLTQNDTPVYIRRSVISEFWYDPAVGESCLVIAGSRDTDSRLWVSGDVTDLLTGEEA